MPPYLVKRLKPLQTTLFAVVFTPPSYRDKTTQHQTKGRAIFRATMEQLLAIYDGQDFTQPYGTNGHRISLNEEPFDQLFLVDGSLMAGAGRYDLYRAGAGQGAVSFCWPAVCCLPAVSSGS